MVILTPKHKKFIIEVTTDSDLNMTKTYEWFTKYIVRFGNKAYLKDSEVVSHITGIKIYKSIPEVEHVVDRKLIKRFTRDD